MTPKIIAKTEPEVRIRQGDILKDIRLISNVRQDGAVVEIAGVTFPLAFVLSQDCVIGDNYFSRSATIIYPVSPPS